MIGASEVGSVRPLVKEGQTVNKVGVAVRLGCCHGTVASYPGRSCLHAVA